ncbi:DUF2497 domain-containing protein [Falsiroseomonas sp.]|uniref:DUF2497 domain-containing protein n=1 Tax=Falsiroseomonas sp. TaxID=2870721 RepID=UPI00356198E8
MSGNTDAPKPGPGDPAMDDILASIRRILNEDDGAGATPPGAGGAAASGEPASEPLDLTESMMVQPAAAPPAAQARAPEPAAPEPPRAAEPPQPAPAVEPAEPEAPSPGAMPAEVLVAPAVAAATTAAVGRLLRAVVQERAATVSRGGPSIEDVVREEIRPLLKDWLDQHLPPLVERLVRAEIERVVGRNL